MFTVNRRGSDSLSGMIPEIDIWRVANLVLNHCGDEAAAKSVRRADELTEEGDHNGATVWRRVTDAIGQLTKRAGTSVGAKADR